MTVEHLILLRHGETDWNRTQRLQGHRDIPLNAMGHHQALDAAPSIVALRPSVMVSSDLSRARETASAVSALTGIEPTVDTRLRETSMGLWEGLTRDEVVAGWPGEWERWRTTSAHAAPPEGESRWQVAKRANEVVEELDAGTATRALIVSHGGLIVGLTGRLLALPEDSWGTLIGVNNCHWVVLHRFAGAWRLHSYNAGLGGVVLPRGEDQVAGT
jgi:2,3-bisphosphoglycerate-dependent phosphoglycerate mutase/probable phosphoglycerate mutase